MTNDPAMNQNQTAPQPPLNQPSASAPILNQNTPSSVTQDQNRLKIIQAQKAKRRSRSLFIGCFSFFLIIIVFFVLTLIIFLTQAKSGQTNPILQLLGISEQNLVRSLMTLTNFGFGLFLFIAFIITIFGLFKILIVKKEDVAGKRSGFISLILGTILCTGLLFGWIATYLYLNSIPTGPKEPNIPLERLIKTDPVDLNNLVAPITINFDASQISFPEKTTFSWDFGDGSPKGSGVTVSHKYTKKLQNEENRYIVTLTITSFQGAKSDKKILNFDVIINNVLPEAIFTMKNSEGEIPLEVSFDASKSVDSDGQIIEYAWDFNEDEEFSDKEGQKVTNIFDKAGTYIVKLRVTDNNNQFSIAEQTVKALSPEKPMAVINSNNPNPKYYAGISYIFSASDSKSPFGDIVKYKWDMGDKTESNTKTVAHEYKRAGIYTITLIVSDDKQQSGETKLDLEVRPPEAAPDAIITTSPAIIGDQNLLIGAAPFKVFFDASKTVDSDNNIVDYRWDLNADGEIDETGRETSYEYEEIGEYKAILYVTDADKNEDRAEITIKVQEQGLKADLKASALSGEAPFEVEFDASGSSYSGGEIISYEWNFGDDAKTRIGEAKITYTYQKIGEFVARVTTIGADGAKATDEINIVVRAVSLEACYTPSKKEGDAPLTVTFNPNCSRGNVQKYLWDLKLGLKMQMILRMKE